MSFTDAMLGQGWSRLFDSTAVSFLSQADTKITVS